MTPQSYTQNSAAFQNRAKPRFYAQQRHNEQNYDSDEMIDDDDDELGDTDEHVVHSAAVFKSPQSSYLQGTGPAFNNTSNNYNPTNVPHQATTQDFQHNNQDDDDDHQKKQYGGGAQNSQTLSNNNFINQQQPQQNQNNPHLSPLDEINEEACDFSDSEPQQNQSQQFVKNSNANGKQRRDYYEVVTATADSSTRFAHLPRNEPQKNEARFKEDKKRGENGRNKQIGATKKGGQISLQGSPPQLRETFPGGQNTSKMPAIDHNEQLVDEDCLEDDEVVDDELTGEEEEENRYGHQQQIEEDGLDYQEDDQEAVVDSELYSDLQAHYEEEMRKHQLALQNQQMQFQQNQLGNEGGGYSGTSADSMMLQNQQAVSSSGADSSSGMPGGGEARDFGKAYKNLVQQMLYQGQASGGNVLVPSEDYQLAMEQEKGYDLNRIQRDLEERRLRQERREREAILAREAKELEGCTFAPQLMTKKKRRGPPAKPTTVVNLQLGVQQPKEHHPNRTELDMIQEKNASSFDGENNRDLGTFLRDQQKFEEEKKLKQLKRQIERDEEAKKQTETRMNAKSRLILAQKEARRKGAINLAVEQNQTKTLPIPFESQNYNQISSSKVQTIQGQKQNNQPMKGDKKQNQGTSQGGRLVTNDQEIVKDDEQFAPKINKRSVQLVAQKRQDVRIEDHLLREGQKKKQKQLELEKQAQEQAREIKKVSDKYILQKFNREFEQAIEEVCGSETALQNPDNQLYSESSETVASTNGSLRSARRVDQKQAIATKPLNLDYTLNYLLFKDFLIAFCVLTESQSTQNCQENVLVLEIWEIIAPHIDREMCESDADSDENEKADLDYIKKLKSQEITLYDLKTIMLAILRLNDGKRFVEGEKAPLLQSENECGFRRKNGRFGLRYEELAPLQKHFNPLYLNRLQLLGQKIEAIKAERVIKEEIKKIELAKPKLNQKSDIYAQKYRERKLAEAKFKVQPEDIDKNIQRNDLKNSDQTTMNQRSVPKVPAVSKRDPNWRQIAKISAEERELKECTFAPNLNNLQKESTNGGVQALVEENTAEEKAEIFYQTTNRLYKLRKDQRQLVDKAKEDYEFEKAQQECTFAPKTNKPIVRKTKVTELSERQKQTMQKQIDRMNKAREDKQRVKKMTERGIPEPKPHLQRSNLERPQVLEDKDNMLLGAQSVTDMSQILSYQNSHNQHVNKVPQTINNAHTAGSQVRKDLGIKGFFQMQQEKQAAEQMDAQQQLTANPESIKTVVPATATGIGLGIGHIEQGSKLSEVPSNNLSTKVANTGTNLESLKNQRLGVTPTPKNLPNPAFSNRNPPSSLSGINRSQEVQEQNVKVERNKEEKDTSGEPVNLEMPLQSQPKIGSNSQQNDLDFEFQQTGAILMDQDHQDSQNMFAEEHKASFISEVVSPTLHQNQNNSDSVQSKDKIQSPKDADDIYDLPLQINSTTKYVANADNLQKNNSNFTPATELPASTPSTASVRPEQALENQDESAPNLSHADPQSLAHNKNLQENPHSNDIPSNYLQHSNPSNLVEDNCDSGEQGVHEDFGESGEEIAEDDDDENPPLLQVEVNLGENEFQTIVVYDGDRAADLAAKFCEENELDEETQARLEALLEQQIASVLTKIDEEEVDSNDPDELT